jgi:hypothetical protein
MMLPEITTLCTQVPRTASPSEYATSVLEHNVLAKPTESSRKKSLRHLIELYSLNSDFILFRALREFTEVDLESLPLIAMSCTYCRDPQVRASFDLVKTLRVGEVLSRQTMEAHLEGAFPNRFSGAMKKSLAQNVNTTWTESGHLTGRARKIRSKPTPNMMASIYAMLAGFLFGLRGEILCNSVFAQLVAADTATIVTHLSSAAARPYVRFRHAGGVTEVDFSPMLTTEELKIANG